jgi:hypothetical protein
MSDEIVFLRKNDIQDRWVEICDRLERLGVVPTDPEYTRPDVFFSDGKRRFKLVDILDKFIEIAERGR